ncbi:thioredoxin family protein [Pleurocapsa sp. FMAR1]|uniref:thioredoxin family protein n=1 Tax=Pleurocapsa sp. FMAR1 TaxID=3040204 RepID=UPI0029C719A9|nr:thioredoxin family protein [Pleurocapsa sp. FMAR1]
MPSVVNETNFQQEVLEASHPVLVHFWTPWCGLCKLIKPMLERIQGDSDRVVKLVAINADENFKLANFYRLKSLPTIMLFDNGELVEKLDGFNSRDRLRIALERLMNNTLSLS